MPATTKHASGEFRGRTRTWCLAADSAVVVVVVALAYLAGFWPQHRQLTDAQAHESGAASKESQTRAEPTRAARV